VTFEPGSQLVQIGAMAFEGCQSLELIIIPELIRELPKGWFRKSALRQVIFKSAPSLLRMITNSKVDLSGHFEIRIVSGDWDCDFDSVGYSVDTVRDVHDSVRLVKKESQS
jgi:hypothetical protein